MPRTETRAIECGRHAGDSGEFRPAKELAGIGDLFRSDFKQNRDDLADFIAESALLMVSVCWPEMVRSMRAAILWPGERR